MRSLNADKACLQRLTDHEPVPIFAVIFRPEVLKNLSVMHLLDL